VRWVEVFAVLVVSHLVGDFLLQTDWQARHKAGGLGPDPVARRALFSHVTAYMVAFVPAAFWLARSLSATALGGVMVGIAGLHLLQDDGRLLAAYARTFKQLEWKPGALAMAVDQSFHVLILFGLALAISS
jgi:hypothetical protein